MGGGGLWPILAQAHTSTLVRIVFFDGVAVRHQSCWASARGYSWLCLAHGRTYRTFTLCPMCLDISMSRIPFGNP